MWENTSGSNPVAAKHVFADVSRQQPAQPVRRKPQKQLKCHCYSAGDATPNATAQDNRRHCLLKAAAMLGATTSTPRPAEAKKVLQREDGSTAEAFEFDIGLRVVSLANSVPADWEQEFRAALRGRAKFSLQRRQQLLDIFDELSKPEKRKSAVTADVVTLGDAFLAPAIQRGLLQPLQHPEQQDWWKLLSPRWQRLLRRDAHGRVSDKGWIWGVPYRWGCNLIAFRTDKLTPRNGGRPIEDWQDLLQPALRERLGVVEAPREFMGAVFKTLGLGFNATQADLAACRLDIDDISRRVSELRAQVRQVSAREQQQALTAGNIWAAVGPSSSLVPLALQHNNIALIAPASGTLLWSDLWVVPRGASGGHLQQGPSPLLPAWLAYGLEPARVSKKRGLQSGASPLLLPGAISSRQCRAASRSGQGTRLASGGNLDLSLGNLMPSEEVLTHSEFLEPLDDEMREIYWQLLRPA